MGYESMTFDAFDARGRPIYHTNVMMSIGEDFAVVCAESITDTEQRQSVISQLESGGLEIIPIDFSQLDAFAGNVLQLASRTGGTVVAMSASAHHAFTAEQLAGMARRARIVSWPIDTIESYAGGSVRCMLAEIHLPRRASGSIS